MMTKTTRGMSRTLKAMRAQIAQNTFDVGARRRGRGASVGVLAASANGTDVILGGIEHRVTPFLMGRSDIDIDEMSSQLCDLVCQGICTPDAGQDMDRLMARLERVADRLDGKAKGG